MPNLVQSKGHVCLHALKLHVIDEIVHRNGLALLEAGNFGRDMPPRVLRIHIYGIHKAKVAATRMTANRAMFSILAKSGRAVAQIELVSKEIQ